MSSFIYVEKIVFSENRKTLKYIENKNFFWLKRIKKCIKVWGNIKRTCKSFGAFYVGATHLQWHCKCVIYRQQINLQREVCVTSANSGKRKTALLNWTFSYSKMHWRKKKTNWNCQSWRCLSDRRESYGKTSEGITKNFRKLYVSQYWKISKGAIFRFQKLLVLPICRALKFWWTIEWGITKSCRNVFVSKKNFVRGLCWCFWKFLVSKNLCLTGLSRFSRIFLSLCTKKIRRGTFLCF